MDGQDPNSAGGPSAQDPTGRGGTSPGPPPELGEVAAKVDTKLEAVLDGQRRHWNEADPRLGEAVGELARMITSGGKRLRAAFCYWAWHGNGGPGRGVDAEELVINVGAAFEFLQVFALIHDDIMDDAATRRGTKTVHVRNAERLTELRWRGEPRRFGEGVAILVGDLGHVYADQLTNGVSDQARRLWDEMRIELNLGQYLDIRSAAAGALDLETARQVATFKSAMYTIVRPMQIGLSLHGDTAADLLEQVDAFGRPLGRAFQLRDDALGVLGEEATVGKPIGDDLREGKPTELLAYALTNANRQQAEKLSIVGTEDLTSAQVMELVEVLHQTGAVAENEAEIHRLVNESAKVLEDIPFSEPAKSALGSLADYVAARTY